MGQPDARRWSLRALTAAPGAPPVLRSGALLSLGLHEENALDYEPALVHLREALAISRAGGARYVEGWVLRAMGRGAWACDVGTRLSAARYEDGLRLFREIDQADGIGWMLICLAHVQLEVGDLDGAVSLATEAFDLGTRSGMLDVIALALRVLAMVAAKRGQ